VATFNERLFAVVDRESVELLYVGRVGLALAIAAHGERVLRHLHACARSDDVTARSDDVIARSDDVITPSDDA